MAISVYVAIVLAGALALGIKRYFFSVTGRVCVQRRDVCSVCMCREAMSEVCVCVCVDVCVFTEAMWCSVCVRRGDCGAVCVCVLC